MLQVFTKIKSGSLSRIFFLYCALECITIRKKDSILAVQNDDMTAISYIQAAVQLPEKAVQATLNLLAEDCTIPFIARYRKDMTGNLDETQIEAIQKANALFEQIEKRKTAILNAIAESGQLTDELQNKIQQSFDLTQLEDLYLPFKKKRKTKADTAREQGLEPLAKMLMAQNSANIEATAQNYAKGEVVNADAALQGARYIVAEWINENVGIRNRMRRLYQRQALIKTVVNKSQKDEEKAQKFQQYFDWEEHLMRTPPHRLLAMLRANEEGIVKLAVDVDTDQALDIIEQVVIKPGSTTRAHLQLAAKDAYSRLLHPALSGECLTAAKALADQKSIEVFAENLKQLLLAAPLGAKRILALDPGYRSGCKLVCLDQNGDLLYNETVYPHAPQNQWKEAQNKIKSLVNAYQIEAISIGNGTASRETEQLIKKIPFDRDVQVFVVNEAGASVYSASKLAREEFPNYDVTVRGAVSIGRRLADPLAELVKIDPKSIGVGQYQHDVDQTLLKNELDSTVMHCVNAVGINLNTASKALLSYVSGIGEKLAENIVNYRSEIGQFESRAQLKKVPRLGEKAYQQAAAFIRIPNAKNPLDNSAVHPEAYKTVETMAKKAGLTVKELIGNKTVLQQLPLAEYATEQVGVLTLKDIVKELERPGLDPRKVATVFEFDASIQKLEDVRPGMVLPGIVNNITHFGCFVDVGVKESGLVHISQLKEGFVADVNEVVKLHQHVQVRVVEVDLDRKRLQLSMLL